MVAVVALARLLVPLAIIRFPLPAIVAALLLDGVDQTIFQAVGAEPAGYQQYDKAFDVYYLAIAYTAMLRNWDNPFAFAVGRALFYYRLIGVAAFEITDARVLLLVFPNTFEYFFIAYELVRLRWDPARLSRRAIIALAAGIWIIIKLPQEWWIHVAQRDFTDTVAANPWVVPVFAAVGALAIAAGGALWPHLPPPSWPATVDAGVHPDPAPAHWSWRALLEKVILLSTITVIFSQMLPSLRIGEARLAFATAGLVAVNAAVSQWRLRRGARWATTLAQFGAMLTTNAAILLVGRILMPGMYAVDITHSLFLLLLLSLMITLYDRYRPYRAARRAGHPRPASPPDTPGRTPRTARPGAAR